MSMREMLRECTLHERRISPPALTATLDIVQAPDGGRMGEYTYEEGYELNLKIAHRFYANKAQYPVARTIAERAIAELLYSGVRSNLNRLRAAVWDRDREEAMKIIDRIDEATSP